MTLTLEQYTEKAREAGFYDYWRTSADIDEINCAVRELFDAGIEIKNLSKIIFKSIAVMSFFTGRDESDGCIKIEMTTCDFHHIDNVKDHIIEKYGSES